MTIKRKPLDWLDSGYFVVGVLASAVALYFLCKIVCTVLSGDYTS